MDWLHLVLVGGGLVCAVGWWRSFRMMRRWRTQYFLTLDTNIALIGRRGGL